MASPSPARNILTGNHCLVEPCLLAKKIDFKKIKTIAAWYYIIYNERADRDKLGGVEGKKPRAISFFQSNSPMNTSLRAFTSERHAIPTNS